MKRFFVLGIIVSGLLLSAPLRAHDINHPDHGNRVVSIGGSVTEIIFALGAGDRIIARDSTSTFPSPRVDDLPNIGYVRRISPEGILSTNPDVIVAEHDVGPPESVSLLKATGVPLFIVPGALDAAGVEAKIHAVGKALGLTEKALALGAKVRERIEDVHARTTSKVSRPKRVLFVLSARGGRILASGVNTSANAMIKLAGAVNALDDFSGYKPISDEAISAAAPEVILMMDRSGDHSLSPEQLFAIPALAITPAAQTQNLVRMNGLYLLGFGPRTADAIAELYNAFYQYQD